MKVAVVGAGPSGLAIALGLVERGVDVTVYERGSTVGGRVRTSRVDGYQIEHGPAGILSGAPATDALLKSLGSDAPRVVEANPAMKKRYLWRGGNRVAVPSFGAFSFGEMLSLWRERSNTTRTSPDETVAEFVRRRFGASLAARFAAPMVLGVFGGDHEALEVESAFPQLAAYEKEHGSVVRGVLAQSKARKAKGVAAPRLMTFEDGMGALPEAMARKLGERVRLGVDVKDVAGLGADHVVLACEPEAVASLVPELGISEPSTPMASVTLAYNRAGRGNPPPGFGILVPTTEKMAVLGIVFMSEVFPTAQAPEGEMLFRVLMGGPSMPTLLDLDDAAILALADEEVRDVLDIGAGPPPTFSHLVRWPRAIPQYVVGHARRRDELQARARARSITIAGTALNGIGVNDVLRDAAAIVERLTA